MIKMLISNASKDGQWAGVPSTMCGVWGAQKCGFILIGLQPSSLSTLLVRLCLHLRPDGEPLGGIDCSDSMVENSRNIFCSWKIISCGFRRDPYEVRLQSAFI